MFCKPSLFWYVTIGSVSALFSVLIGCDGPTETDEASDQTETPGPSPAPSPYPSPTPETDPSALALIISVNSSYTAGNLSTIHLDTLEVSPDMLEVGSDTGVETDGERMYLLIRDWATGDHRVSAREILPPFTEIYSVSAGFFTNPQDMAFYHGRGYISLNEGTGVLVFDVHDGTYLRTIDLSAYDPDGSPNPYSMLVLNDTLYVGLQRIQYGEGVTYLDLGLVVGVDLSEVPEPVMGTVELSGSNVWSLIPDQGDILVSTRGTYGMADGGIERISIPSMESGGFFLTEESLGTLSLGPFVVLNGTGYLEAGTSIISFETVDGTHSPQALPEEFAAGGVFSDGERLWVYDLEGMVWLLNPEDSGLTPAGGLDPGAFSIIYDMSFTRGDH